jgi:aminobenzoyl-glutamate utilization protein B
MHKRSSVIFLSQLLGLAAASLAQSPHQQIVALVDRHSAAYVQASRAIWEFAELGFHEDKSSALLQRDLQEAGFRIEAGVADEPTAFIATYGQGRPIVGILGEFDALPGLSQAAAPDRSPVVAAGPGHGCGHNLLGAGAALAAVALKEYMETHRVTGTLRYYGTPAEEGGDGKVYMVRAGLFRDVDVVLHWHPADRNAVANGGALAITSAKFLFHGVAAHAAFAPERGRWARGSSTCANTFPAIRAFITSSATAGRRPISCPIRRNFFCTRAARRSTRWTAFGTGS